MRVSLSIGLVLCGLLLGCESDSDDGPANGETCDVEAPTECPSDGPTYADVEPIFQERCVVCHEGNPENEKCPTCWALTDYGHVKDWEDPIRAAMVTCEMPPEGSGVTMTNAERMEILEWIRCDAPE